MILLLSVLAVFVLTASSQTTLGSLAEDTTARTSQICPGTCLRKEFACNVTLDGTDCGQDSNCCLDETDHPEDTMSELHQSERLESNDQNPWDTKMNATNKTQFVKELAAQSRGLGVTDLLDSETGQLYTSLPETTFYDYTGFSTETDSTTIVPAEFVETEKEISECPGICVPNEYAAICQYVISLASVCDESKTCCLTEKEASKMQSNLAKVPTISSNVKVGPSPHVKPECPGTCVHPSATPFCDKIMKEYECPLNSKCCNIYVSPAAHFVPDSLDECPGECLPNHVRGLCIPPFHLIPEVYCQKPRTTCCMQLTNAPAETSTKRSLLPVIFPNIRNMRPQSTAREYNAGAISQSYLAQDESTGQIFQVAENGHIVPLATLSSTDRLDSNIRHLADLEQQTVGKVSIFTDTSGVLYQYVDRTTPQLEPETATQPELGSRQAFTPDFLQAELNFEQDSRTDFGPEFLNKDIYYSEETTQLPESIVSIPDDSDVEDNMKDIIIPEADEVPSIESSSIPPGETIVRPPCPGSCISSFLKFTCFRNSAVYDGFTCPIRSVCCASLKDIKEHEAYLKAFSPYFSTPAPMGEPEESRCGVKGVRGTPRVIGGKDSLPGEWCWQVAIINVENQYLCGGALIDDSWVLTAAHCVTGYLHQTQALYIRAGVTDLVSASDNAAGQTRRVLSAFVHHNHNSGNLDNDIALLRLQNPVNMNANVCVVCLPSTRPMLKDGTMCTVTSYGFVSKGGTMSLKLREANVPLVHDMDCISNITEALGSAFILPASSFCAGGHGEADACQGDAGGPLVCEVGNLYELTGLVSWGLGCGHNEVPSIYIKVNSFIGWIHQIIGASAFLKALR